VAPAAIRPGAEVLGHEVLGQLLRTAAHLGRDGDPGIRVVAQPGSDDALAAAVAVDVGRVEEGDARAATRIEPGARVRLAHLTPVGAELPGSEPDDGDVAAGAAESAMLHGSSLGSRYARCAGYSTSGGKLRGRPGPARAGSRRQLLDRARDRPREPLAEQVR